MQVNRLTEGIRSHRTTIPSTAHPQVIKEEIALTIPSTLVQYHLPHRIHSHRHNITRLIHKGLTTLELMTLELTSIITPILITRNQVIPMERHSLSHSRYIRCHHQHRSKCTRCLIPPYTKEAIPKLRTMPVVRRMGATIAIPKEGLCRPQSEQTVMDARGVMTTPTIHPTRLLE